MRVITLGVNSNGRSCVKSTTEHKHGDIAWSTPSFPPQLGYTRPQTFAGDTMSFEEAGGAACQFVRFEPNTIGRTHRFDGFSVVTIFKGGTTVTLEEGSANLKVGDVLIMPAIVHGWKTGPEGCEFTTMRFYLPPA